MQGKLGRSALLRTLERVHRGRFSIASASRNQGCGRSTKRYENVERRRKAYDNLKQIDIADYYEKKSYGSSLRL